jgi:hypothetical protein
MSAVGAEDGIMFYARRTGHAEGVPGPRISLHRCVPVASGVAIAIHRGSASQCRRCPLLDDSFLSDNSLFPTLPSFDIFATNSQFPKGVIADASIGAVPAILVRVIAWSRYLATPICQILPFLFPLVKLDFFPCVGLKPCVPIR